MEARKLYNKELGQDAAPSHLQEVSEQQGNSFRRSTASLAGINAGQRFERWVSDFSRLKSMTWRWWTRTAPVGTESTAGCTKSIA